MRLKIWHDKDVPGPDTWYFAGPDLIHSVINPDTIEQDLERLDNRIRPVGTKILGNNLRKVCTKKSPGSIGLCFQSSESLKFSKGLATGLKKNDFRSFLGWVTIFDIETVTLSYTV